MMNDLAISILVDFTNAKDCFTDISISGGVSYFFRTINEEGDCLVVSKYAGKENIMRRKLNEFNVKVRYNEAVNIIRKIHALGDKPLDKIISPISPYGLSTKVRGGENKDTKNEVKLYLCKGVAYISMSRINKGLDSIDTFRTMISQTSAEHAGESSKDREFRVLTKTIRVLEPGEVCTLLYLCRCF